MTPEMAEVMMAYLNQDSSTMYHRTFDIDRKGLWPGYKGPPLAHFDDGSYSNFWGVRMKDVSYGKGIYSEAIGFPLVDAATVADIEAYEWPSVDLYDYAGMPEKLETMRDYAITLGYHSIGWFSWEMRGMARFLEDLIAEPGIAHAIVDRVADFGYEYFARVIASCKEYVGENAILIQIADDFATQDGLLISPRLYREYFKKPYRKIIDLAHAAGLRVEFHMCGAAVGLLPELIETGIDILNPIQTSDKGMDPKRLKDEFGMDVAFSGGIDVQQLLPFASVQEVRDEVRYVLDTMGDGGYIFEPSHAIQIGTPPENIEAMYQAMHDYYR